MDLGGRSEKKPSGNLEVVKTLISLASLLLAAITLAAAKEVPWWGLSALAMILAILLGFLLWIPLSPYLKELRSKRIEHRSARLYYAELEQMLNRLLRELSDSNSNGLVHPLRPFATTRDKNGQFVADHLSGFTRIAEWVRFFLERAQQRRAEDFIFVARAINLASTQYWWACYDIQNRLQVILGQKLLEESQLRALRQGWNSGREGANRFLIDWLNLSDKLAREIGVGLGGAHHEALKVLE